MQDAAVSVAVDLVRGVDPYLGREGRDLAVGCCGADLHLLGLGVLQAGDVELLGACEAEGPGIGLVDTSGSEQMGTQTNGDRPPFVCAC